MSELNNQQPEGLAGRMISEFMNERWTQGKKFNHEENNSFMFLEKNTLNVILDHLLTGDKRSSNGEMNGEFEGIVMEKLDEMMEKNKKEFEDIINQLKRLS